MNITELYLYFHYSTIEGREIIDDYFWTDHLVDANELNHPYEWTAHALPLTSVGVSPSNIYVTESLGNVSYAYSMNVDERDFTRLLEVSEYIPNPNHDFFQQGLKCLEKASNGRFEWYGQPIEKIHHTTLES